jgi:aspartyl-tRNA(Asn)/glutamyl-tRNA(Gln) amidotransferase subunit B
MSQPPWETVIGLEVHAQLATRSKIFSRESAAFGADPNEHVNEVCAGMPGVLPVLNRQAVHMAMVAGFALGSTVHRWSQFARKNYFYPDLPKGYQISQFQHPICSGGHVGFVVDGQQRSCALTRIHMEEDAGKNVHDGAWSLVDLNRAGVPLIEIVGEPDLRSADEAVAYLKELRTILRYLGVCDGNLEEGSFRCDVNVSVRRRGEPLGTRAEIKNVNSFRFVQRAIEHEVIRQINLLEDGGKVVQETRLFNHDSGVTSSMRSKEEAHDYRYFPDPDLPPLVIDDAWWQAAKGQLPELPAAKRHRYEHDFGLSAYDVGVLTVSRPVAEFFEAVLASGDNPKTVANWVTNEVLRVVANPEEGLDDLNVTPEALGQLLAMVERGELTGKMAKTVFGLMLETGRDPATLADERGLRPVRDEGAIEAAAADIVASHPDEVAAYRAGKTKLMSFFLGQIMQKTRGKADPKLARQILAALLDP